MGDSSVLLCVFPIKIDEFFFCSIDLNKYLQDVLMPHSFQTMQNTVIIITLLVCVYNFIEERKKRDVKIPIIEREAVIV